MSQFTFHKTMYELIIIGGGPGGVAAGIYSARKKIKTLLVTNGFGGQSLVSAEIQNWIGTKSISGFELAKNLEEHLRAQERIEIVKDLAVGVKKLKEGFEINTEKGKVFETKYVLIASGSRRKKLGVPGEKEFDGKGVVYCSTCDAPIFKDKVVAVVGGGNAGLEAVTDLLPYASKIYVLEYMDSVKGDAVTLERIRNNANAEIITSAETLEILGKEFVSGLRYKDRKSGNVKELKVEGVFVEVGLVPNSDFVKDMVHLNKHGEIIVDPKTQATSREGIWAAGDVTDLPYRQNNISVGDAIKAVLNIYDHLK